MKNDENKNLKIIENKKKYKAACCSTLKGVFSECLEIEEAIIKENRLSMDELQRK